MISAPWQKPFRGMQIDKAHPLSKGLVGCWILNEKTGDTVFDLSKHGNDGTIVGADWVPDGLDLNGTSDYVGSGSPTVISNTASTVSFLVNNSSPLHATPAIYNEQGDLWYDFIIYYGDGAYNEVRVFYFGGGGNVLNSGAAKDMADGQWHNGIYLQRAANDRELFIDNVSVDSDTTNIATETGTQTNLGSAVGGNQYFKGTIANVMTWNRALSPYERAWLNREPYAMFQQPISPASLYYEAGAPPSTAYPVFIHHQNQLRA